MSKRAFLIGHPAQKLFPKSLRQVVLASHEFIVFMLAYCPDWVQLQGAQRISSHHQDLRPAELFATSMVLCDSAFPIKCDTELATMALLRARFVGFFFHKDLHRSEHAFLCIFAAITQAHFLWSCQLQVKRWLRKKPEPGFKSGAPSFPTLISV